MLLHNVCRLFGIHNLIITFISYITHQRRLEHGLFTYLKTIKCMLSIAKMFKLQVKPVTEVYIKMLVKYEYKTKLCPTTLKNILTIILTHLFKTVSIQIYDTRQSISVI